MSGCPHLFTLRFKFAAGPQQSLLRFPFFCPPPNPRQPAPPPIIWTWRTGKLESKALKHDIFFRVTSQQPFPLHPRKSLPFLEGSTTSSPGLFRKKNGWGPPIFLGKSPGDEVGMFHEFHEQFLPLSTFGFSWDVFASLAVTDFVRLLESKVSQLAELPG